MDLGHSSLNGFRWPTDLHHRLLALATRPDGRPTPRLEVTPAGALLARQMHRSIPGQRHLAAALPLELPQQRARGLDLRAAARELRGGGATIAGLVDAQLRPRCCLDVSQDCASPGHQALKSLPVQLNRLRSMSVEHFLQERPRPTNSVRLSEDVHPAGLGSRIHLQPSSGAGFDVLDARARPSDDDADDSARHLHTSLGRGAAFQPLQGLLDCCKLSDELNSTSLSCRDRLRVDKNGGTSVGFKHPNPRTAFPNDPPSNVLRNLETPKGMSNAQEVFQLGNGIGYAKGLNPADSLEVLVHPQVEHPALVLQSPSLCACLADDPPTEALGDLEVQLPHGRQAARGRFHFVGQPDQHRSATFACDLQPHGAPASLHQRPAVARALRSPARDDDASHSKADLRCKQAAKQASAVYESDLERLSGGPRRGILRGLKHQSCQQ
mmetsp:Transcript_58220/g.167005  ORF Transcript_58220/g.167005 Transcript_58220/m.167005 type:complete len:439 (+) Transcript_58220:2589-3905(+)